jgi:hypothetical protein
MPDAIVTRLLVNLRDVLLMPLCRWVYSIGRRLYWMNFGLLEF